MCKRIFEHPSNKCLDHFGSIVAVVSPSAGSRHKIQIRTGCDPDIWLVNLDDATWHFLNFYTCVEGVKMANILLNNFSNLTEGKRSPAASGSPSEPTS